MQYRISKEQLQDFCTKACQSFGYSEADAKITAEILTQADLTGTHSHGTKNLLGYMRKTAAGGIHVHANIQTLQEGPAWALIDGDAGIGMAVSAAAMEKALEKAAACGIGMVTVRNSTHFGAAGAYSCMAARKGMIGIAMSNTDPNMAIPGGKGREIGNSPISVAVPQASGQPLFLDIALSATAALKIEQAQRDGKTIPDTWAVNSEGFPTTDPAQYFDGGAAQPMAAHKGYGLSMMVEILTGILSGGAFLHQITSWGWDLPNTNKVSHCFMAIDISKFMTPDDFAARLQTYTDAIHNSPRRSDSQGILVPGELENNRAAKALNGGILLPHDVGESLLTLSELSGVAITLETVEE